MPQSTERRIENDTEVGLLGFQYWRWIFPLLILPVILSASDNANILSKCQFVSAMRYWHYKTDHFWNRNGQKVSSLNHFEQNRGDLCFALGLTDRDTLHLQGSYSQISESANGNVNGFGDTQLSWKHYFGRKWNHYWTGRAQLVIPSGGRKYSLRYGRWGGELDIFLKKQLCLNRSPLWYDLGGGYRIYSGYPSDQIRGYFEAGYTPFKRFSLLIDSQLECGVHNGTKKDPPNLILYNANYKLLRGRAYGVFQAYRTAYIYAGAFSHLWGRNVGTGGGFFVGSYISF